MSDAFNLRWKLDRPYLEENTPGDVYALLTIEPNASTLSSSTPPVSIPTHLILLVDVSESMDVLVRRDPKAQKVGVASAEGKAAQRVVSEVPSRREMAADVVQKMVERLAGDDLLTIIAFDDQPHLLAQAIIPSDMDAVWSAIQQLNSVGGGGTAMGKAFEAVRDVLSSVDDSPRTRKLVLLTDGEDEKPDHALAAAKSVGLEFHLPIVAFGTGDRCPDALRAGRQEPEEHPGDQRAAPALAVPGAAGARAVSVEAGDSFRRRSGTGPQSSGDAAAGADGARQGVRVPVPLHAAGPADQSALPHRQGDADVRCAEHEQDRREAGDEHHRGVHLGRRPGRRALRRCPQGAVARRGAAAGALPPGQDRSAQGRARQPARPRDRRQAARSPHHEVRRLRRPGDREPVSHDEGRVHAKGHHLARDAQPLAGRLVAGGGAGDGAGYRFLAACGAAAP
ncbi:MAG: VWA domain-containing protein [Planctomycetes bacterium]|nr:VWA domain-containing protein [Planctomycetota bacterium]